MSTACQRVTHSRSTRIATTPWRPDTATSARRPMSVAHHGHRSASMYRLRRLRHGLSGGRDLPAVRDSRRTCALREDQRRVLPVPGLHPEQPMSPGARPLRVAVVGTGPAGCYAAEHLLSRDDVAVEINMFDRLPTPYGLVRAGVAPDHPQTKKAARLFEWTAARPGVQMNLNVDIGRHLSHEELLAHHHAVVYAVGATRDRTLGIAGEDLPGSHGAGDFVGLVQRPSRPPNRHIRFVRSASGHRRQRQCRP